MSGEDWETKGGCNGLSLMKTPGSSETNSVKYSNYWLSHNESCLSQARCIMGQANPSENFLMRPTTVMNYSTKVCVPLWDLNVLAKRVNKLLFHPCCRSKQLDTCRHDCKTLLDEILKVGRENLLMTVPVSFLTVSLRVSGTSQNSCSLLSQDKISLFSQYAKNTCIHAFS